MREREEGGALHARTSRRVLRLWRRQRQAETTVRIAWAAKALCEGGRRGTRDDRVMREEKRDVLQCRGDEAFMPGA